VTGRSPPCLAFSDNSPTSPEGAARSDAPDVPPRRRDATHDGTLHAMTVMRSMTLFLLAAVAEIGGAWLVWQGVREQRGPAWIAAGVVALGAYGFVATLQPDPHFGRILAAYGGVFVAGSLVWGVVLDGFRPDRWDLSGAAICLIGVAVIMYAPRG
jgi:small multidrug resistance family-3 protein